MLDVLIKNCKKVEHDGVTECSIGVKDGVVAALYGVKEILPDARTVIDAQGRYVLPGAVDSHSHIGQLPGSGQPRPQTQEENFKSESLSALFGGTTTAMNYIFTQGSICRELDRHRAIAKEYSALSMFFHGALMNEAHLHEIPEAVRQGVRWFKIFLPYKGEEALKLGGLSSLNDGQLINAFELLARYSALPIVHAENPELIDYYMEKFEGFDRQDMAAWEATRPGIVEGEAVNKTIYLAKKSKCSVCIAHVSSKEAVELIEAEKGSVLLETTPHYLTLTAEAQIGSLGKVSPPVRHEADRESLWAYIEKGLPVVIGSDHNAWQKQHKQDMWQGLAGLPGNAYILPILISEGVYRRGLSWEDVVRLTSYTAACRFGLYPGKGTLQVGADADLAIISTGLSRKVAPQETGSIVDYSPYADYSFWAWPDTVMCGGRICRAN